MTQVVDPVCGMAFNAKIAEATAVYQGQTYYFCSPACKKTFEKDPARYAQQEQQGGQSSHQHQH